MANKEARLPALEDIISAGINPKNGLPYRFSDSKVTCKEDIRRALRVVDEQDAVNRYVWFNLPMDITGQELERMIYYKGQLAFFFDKGTEQFYLMPYALDGTIDYYGRFNTVHPVPMSAGTDEDNKAQREYLSTLKLKCLYGAMVPEDDVDPSDYCVLLHDYTKQMSQTIIPRSQLNEAILDSMSDCIPFMNTNLLAGTGVKGVRVADADQASGVIEGARSLRHSALVGEPWVALLGAVDFQELTGQSLSPSSEYMLAMQQLDNLRLSLYGIDNGGLFEKKSQMLQSEFDINGGPIGLVLQDGLSIRQHFCTVCNLLFGTMMWCDVSETISKADRNGDGLLYDDDTYALKTGVKGESEDVDTEGDL